MAPLHRRVSGWPRRSCRWKVRPSPTSALRKEPGDRRSGLLWELSVRVVTCLRDESDSALSPQAAGDQLRLSRGVPKVAVLAANDHWGGAAALGKPVPVLLSRLRQEPPHGGEPLRFPHLLLEDPQVVVEVRRLSGWVERGVVPGPQGCAAADN